MMTYNICMFAYNEEKNIRNSISSVIEQASSQLNQFYLIANGCSDRTVEVASQMKHQEGFEKLNVVELSLGDKCNAWNHYMHQLSDNADIHFFVDADVEFSSDCFDKLARHLGASEESTVAIAGMPLSGRNRGFYESLVKERACFFGNLYGLKKSFIERVKSYPFRLPIGLNWIDSFLTKAVNTDLSFGAENLPNRVTYLEGVGYKFSKLSVLSWADIKLYVNRIARYELGKLQEKHLDRVSALEWPHDMNALNLKISGDFDSETSSLSMVKKALVKRRLKKMLKNVQSK